ncbi:MAG: sugar ABC transporter ATP-binding protein [Fimbriimonadaceae bacterium]
MAFLEFRDISKAFPGVQALDRVSFDVEAGTAHALCGENGAGKSTLLKILAGAYQADSGTISVAGQRFQPESPSQALQGGVAVIYQELNLINDANVAENVLLGHLPSRTGWVDRRELHRRASEVLAKLGLDADPSARLGDLPIAQRQLVEIAKALSRDARVIAFDEPTSSLSTRESDRLFEVIETLRTEGCAILYVSHRMVEIERVCQAATVLRDGAHVATYTSVAEVGADRLVEDMVGRQLTEVFPYRERSLGEVVYSAEALTGPGLRAPVSLSLREGEIVGVYGLAGSGRTELLKAIYGAGRGTVSVGGKLVRVASPREALTHGIALAPEDRKKEALFPQLSVRENMAVAWREGAAVRAKSEREAAERQVDRLAIKMSSLEAPVSQLSGGNQQKVVLGRWLHRPLRLLLLDEPTRGVDIGAKRELHEAVAALAAEGVAVLMVSSETAEVMGVSDRILVMREGELAGELGREEATEEALVRLSLP